MSHKYKFGYQFGRISSVTFFSTSCQRSLESGSEVTFDQLHLYLRSLNGLLHSLSFVSHCFLSPIRFDWLFIYSSIDMTLFVAVFGLFSCRQKSDCIEYALFDM